MDARSPALGARVVVRAWTDPAFKARLLANGTAACEELGIEMGPTKLVVVENTPEVHNLIVCTLCSCYPRMLLGLPPDWYKGRAYRARAVREPRQVLKEFGLALSDKINLRVHDSTADMRYMVLPGAAGRHRRLERGTTGRHRHPRLHDRRGGAESRVGPLLLLINSGIDYILPQFYRHDFN